MADFGANTLVGVTITVRTVRQGGSTGRVHLSAVSPSMVCPAGLGLKLVKPTLKSGRSGAPSVREFGIPTYFVGTYHLYLKLLAF